MEFNEIKDEINKAIEGCNDPHITFLKPFLLMLFTLFENQNHLIESLNQKIETLQFALQQKSLTARKGNNQNFNGKGNESQKPGEEEKKRKRNSTDPNPDDPAPKKEKPKRNVKHVENNVYYDITGKIINSEEANKL